MGIFGKPRYEANPAHDSRAPHARKTPEPLDAERVFARAIEGPPAVGKESTWYGLGHNREIYRFSSANDGTAHFSGMTGGFGIRMEDIPIKIRRRLGRVR